METTEVLATNSLSKPLRRFWPEFTLWAGLVLIVVAAALGKSIDGRNIAVGSMDAAVIVIVMAVAAVWCYATFLVGRLSKIMKGKPGEGFVMLMAVTIAALCGLPVSLIVGWAIRLSISSDLF